MKRGDSKGVLLLLAASVLWSFGGVGIKLLPWNGYAISGIRGLISALTLLLFIKRPHLPKSGYQLAAILSYVGVITLAVLATKLTTSANAILLQYTAPLYSAVLGFFILHEKVRKSDVLELAALFFGLLLFVYDGLSGGGLAGNLLALLSGVCYGAMNVFMRACGTKTAAENVFWGNLIVFVLMLPFLGAPQVTPRNVLLILGLGVFQIGLAYILYSLAISQVEALKASVITVLEPILNPVWVMLFYGESPSGIAIVGGIIVLLAVVLREIWRKREQTAALSDRTE